MRIDAIVFDYGNTLVPFGRPQIDRYNRALLQAVEDHIGPVDRGRFGQIRERQRLSPYAGDPPEYRETDLRRITAELVRELGGPSPTSEDVDRIMNVRSEIFVSVIEAPDYLHEVLQRLRDRYRLGLLSNYPSGDDIRESLARIDIDRFFDAVVVSADVGFVKPHGLPFQTVFEKLGVKPERALHVGDSWLADVQGARRAGAHAAWIRQYEALERTWPGEGNLLPDFELEHLHELPERLEQEHEAKR